MFLLFILVPMADLILLLMIARVHWLISVLSIIVSGLVGAWLVRRQGLAVGNRLRSNLSQGHIPTEPLMDGGMVLLAAGLLLTPGLITDLFGITFLIPVCRKWYRVRIGNWLKRKVQFKTFGFGPQSDGSTLDGDFVRKSEGTETFDNSNDFSGNDSEIIDDQLIEGKSRPAS